MQTANFNLQINYNQETAICNMQTLISKLQYADCNVQTVMSVQDSIPHSVSDSDSNSSKLQYAD